MDGKTLEIRNLCLEHMDIIFYDLVKRGLLHQESKFFSEAKKSTWKVCFQTLYPLMEFFDNFSESNFDFFLHNSFLFFYSFFLDRSFDSLEKNPSTQARASQISTYLTIQYFEYLMKSFDTKVISLFYKFYGEQTNYLIAEKKWAIPQPYISVYGSVKRIYKKCVLLLFPFELIKINLHKYKSSTLKELFINYFSFILLADDLADLELDISHHCLTYPIATYFKLKGKLPRDVKDMTTVTPQMIKILQEFLENIKKLEIEIGKRSSIINDTISSIKKELNVRGFEI